MTKKTSLAEALKAATRRKSRACVLDRFPAQARELIAALEDVATGKLPRLSLLHICELFLEQHPEITGLNATGLRNWIYKTHYTLYTRVLQ